MQLLSADCFPLISGLGETFFLDLVKVVDCIDSFVDNYFHWAELDGLTLFRVTLVLALHEVV